MRYGLFCCLVLTWFSFSSHAKNHFDTKLDVDECIEKVEQLSNRLCKFKLSQDYQSTQTGLPTKTAFKLFRNYHNIFMALSSKEERLAFSYEVIDYLANKHIIRPYIYLVNSDEKPVLFANIKHTENESSSSSLKLTRSLNETIELLYRLENGIGQENKVYTKQIESIFSTM